MENNIETVFATKIPITLSVDENTKVNLSFNKMTISYSAFFRKKWGDKVLNDIETFQNLDTVLDILYVLMTKESKEELREYKDHFMDYDENDNLIDMAPRTIDKMKRLLTQDQKALIELTLAVAGTDLEKVEEEQKQFDALSPEKKKELILMIKKMTGPSSLRNS